MPGNSKKPGSSPEQPGPKPRPIEKYSIPPDKVVEGSYKPPKGPVDRVDSPPPPPPAKPPKRK